MDALEERAVSTLDFSDQGILESYHSRVNVLDAPYSYTNLRQVDWGAVRGEYLPYVEAAEAAGDMAAYFVALAALAVEANKCTVSDLARGAPGGQWSVVRAFQAVCWYCWLFARELEMCRGKLTMKTVRESATHSSRRTVP